MAFVGNIIARVGADIRPLQTGLQQAQRSLTVFSGSASSSLAGFSVLARAKSMIAAAGIGYGIKKAIESAMDVTESESLFNVSMGSMAAAARQWSDNLQQTLGLNAYEVRKNVGLFYNMTTSMGLARDKAYEVSTGISKLAYDMASFYNISNEQMFEKLQSGLSGEVEPLKRLGVVVSETQTKMWAYKTGLVKVGAELNEQQKIMARYGTIMEQTKNAQGDLARTITSPSNQLRLLSGQLQLVMINLGNAFVPILQIVLPILTEFAKGLVRVTATFSQFMTILFGGAQAQQQTAVSAADAAAGTNKLGTATKKAGSAASKAVAGFDEINSLQEKIADSADNAADSMGGVGDATGSGIGSNAGGGLIPPDIQAKALEMREAITQAWNDITSTISNNKEIIIAAVTGIGVAFAGLGVALAIPAIISGFETLYIVGLYAIDAIAAAIAAVTGPVGIAIAIVAALAAGFVYLYQTNEPFRTFVNDVWQGIKDFFYSLWVNVLVPFGTFLSTVFSAAWESLKTGLKWLYDNVLVPIGAFFYELWLDIFDPLAKMVGDQLSIVFQGFADIMKSFYDEVLVPLGNFLKDVFNAAFSALHEILSALWNEVFVPFATHIRDVFGPAFKELGNVITTIWDTVFKPLLKFIVGEFVTGFKSTFQGIGEVINDLKPVCIGIINFIKDVFKGDWGKAWEDVKQVFKGIVDTLGAVFKAPINTIIDMINSFIDKVNSISIPPIEFNGVTVFKGVSGFGINHINKLANGGITTGPTLAMIGDNPGGKELVMPLDGTALDDFAGKLGTALLAAGQFGSGKSSGGGHEVVVKIDSTALARILIPAMAKENQRQGSYAIVQGVG